MTEPLSIRAPLLYSGTLMPIDAPLLVQRLLPSQQNRLRVRPWLNHFFAG